MTEPLPQGLSAALDATYEVHRELGGGGMSRVFLATDRALGRQVVIKTLPADIMSSDAVERFKREIRTAAQLQHPNIVPLLAAGDVDGAPYFTMPWVEGASLRERLQRDPLPLEESIGILRDMARALGAAHAKGIVHRDIKPENVLLSSGAALITDFGVARALSAAAHPSDDAGEFRTATGISVGTPAYMAPEQFAGDTSVDHRADIYAWGIVAYELLTGHHPFEGARGTALLKAHLATTPHLVSDVAPSLPRNVADVVRRALEKDPDHRPASADDLVVALGAVGTPAPGIIAAPRGRSRVVIGVVGVVALAVVLAFAMSRRGGASGDERMIAIAPFRIGGAAADVHYLREGLGDLMTPQLHSIPGVSAPSMRVMLEQWRKVAGSATADLPDDRALGVAGAAGAGQLILGEIVGTPSHMTISAQLMRVRDGKVLAANAKVEGPADSAAALAARLVATLLSIRDGSTVERVRNVVSASPEAITPFLVGERAYRHGRYLEASKAFASAYEHDTTFALAALRTNTMNGWNFQDVIPGPWLDRAWRHRDQLHGNDSLMLVSLAGAKYPAPTSISEYHRGLRAAAEQGNTAELWYNWADAVFHRGSHTGDTLSDLHSLEGFKRGETLDSSFVPSLEHQSTIYSRLGDTVNMRAAWQRQRMLDSTGDFYVLTSLLNVAELGTEAEAIAAIDAYVNSTLTPNFFLPTVLTGDYPFGVPIERRLRLTDEFLRLAESKRPGPSADPSIMLTAAAMYINTGRPRPIVSAPGKDSALYVNALNTLAWLVWDGDSATAARTGPELVRVTAAIKDSTYSLARSTALLTLGLWSLNRGDTAGAEKARAGLRALKSSALPGQVNAAPIHEKLLAAHLAVARKASDAKPRLMELDSLLMDTPAHRNLVLSLGDLLVSRLWETLGDDHRAWSAIDRKHAHIGSNAFASARLRGRARIAERIGRRAEGIEALRLFIALRTKADVSHQRELADMRASLAKLERASRGK